MRITLFLLIAWLLSVRFGRVLFAASLGTLAVVLFSVQFI